MKRYRFSTLGDEQKLYEQRMAGEMCLYGLPIIARLDGRGFHNFTKGLKRPYDENLSFCMRRTALALLEQTHCDIAYTQSDEITLIWRNEYDQGKESKAFFNGKVQKMVSVLAATATMEFNRLISRFLPEEYSDRKPMFDCRVWQVPNLEVAAENLLWREMDATKNSITMAASAYYPHSELQGKHSGDKHEMLFQKGINWNDYPTFFKKGVYISKRTVMKELDPATLAKIPEAHRPTGPIERNVIVELEIPKATSIENLVEVYFHGKEPICNSLMESGTQPSEMMQYSDSSETIVS